MIFALAFSTYLGRFALNYVATYAGLASVMIAIVFLYSLAAIFIFGGEVNAALMRARGVGDDTRKSQLAIDSAILFAFANFLHSALAFFGFCL